MTNKLIVANWKMNGRLEFIHDDVAVFADLLHSSKPSNDIVICPPHSYLQFLSGRLAGLDVYLGAQDCSAYEKGAYTGDVSAGMLADVGASYVIVGHSERRQYHNESNELLRLKLEQALNAGVTPIFCVGESAGEYDAGNTQSVLKQQLQILKGLNINDKESGLVIAYEPVWAIGTGKLASNSDIENSCAFILDEVSMLGLKPKVLYGGSVNGKSAGDILSLDSVGGVLVGGASLNPKEFYTIATSYNIVLKAEN